MSTFLGCIADDFTGATDLAALLARSGAPVSLRIGVPSQPPSDSTLIEVIALKIRTSPVDEAKHEALAAFNWLKAAGAQKYFWKYCSTFDSTVDGNIGPVAETLMNASGAKQAVYCPAFPENGRSIYMGNLFVGDQPLSESPMKDHPLTPMRDSNLVRLLSPQVVGDVGLVNYQTVAKGVQSIKNELNHQLGQNKTHAIIDAVAEIDLSTIAAACFENQLLTGGSAVASHLPTLYAENQWVKWEAQTTTKRVPESKTVVLSGSCSAMTNAQVAHYVQHGAPAFKLDPLELAANGIDPVLAWISDQNFNKAPLIYATSTPARVKEIQQKLGSSAAGALIENALAQCAVHARNEGARRFIVAGGETSGAITQALGATTLDIGPEISPGVPWTFCHSNGYDIAITLKSGNFGAEDFFSYAPTLLPTS